MRWLEVELTVPGELAEPISELLSRYGEGGVALATDKAHRFHKDPALVHVRAYLADGPNLASEREAIERGLWHLGQIQPIPDANYRYIEDKDWSTAWKANYRPIEVGRQLLVQPSWLEPEPSDRIVLKMDPGMAFGTGTHPTTLLCLQLLEDWIEPGHTLVDLGSGSGILSIAGILLGASRALAYDVSDQAVEATRANAQVNGVSERLVAEKGSLDELLAAMERGLKPDLIVANILAPILEEMLSSGLASALRSGSMLVLSGILEEQLEGLRRAAVGHDLTVIEERS
ncbi:MAG: 50S ribosomal protein L11 methyltransferase, partial [Anaerolineales bacterium]